MLTQYMCRDCKTLYHRDVALKVAYIKEGTKWRRVAWACPVCGHTEQGFKEDFRFHRKARVSGKWNDKAKA
jgi:rubredoxin